MKPSEVVEVEMRNPEVQFHPVAKGNNAPKPEVGGVHAEVPQGPTSNRQVQNGNIAFQVRNPEPQYPDFKIDHKPTSNIQDFSLVSKDSVKNPSDLVDKQVFYLDSSPQEQEAAAAISSKHQFVDKLFPPTDSSLFGLMDTSEQDYVQRKKLLTWRPIFDLIKDGDMFTGGISPTNIYQGGFGNCYFLVGLSALAERPQRIRDIFLKKQAKQRGPFSCSLIFRGRWKTIYLDTNFPLPKDQYIGHANGAAMSSPGQLWVSVIEKAWNKLYGSYYITEGGFTEEAIHDLTGAHVHFIDTRDPNFDKEAAWRDLLEGTKMGYAMLAESPQGSDADISKTGMVFGHAYTILGAYQIDYLGSTQRLVRCRNPWGEQEWGFEWSDDDRNWDRVSKADKQKIDYDGNLKDGQFFIHYDDFCQWLTKITIGEVHDGYSYVYASQPATSGKGVFFKVTIFKEGEYSFQLNQTSFRLIDQRLYLPATMNIGRILPNGSIKYYKGTQSAFQTVFRKHTLPPGDYIVHTEQGFHDIDPFRDATLGICGQYYCTVEPAPPGLADNFHPKLFLSRAREVNQQLLPNVYEANEVLLDEGYLYTAVINDSDKPVRVMVKAYDNLNKGVKKVKPGPREIQPKNNLILYQKIPNNKEWTSKLCGIQLIQ